MNKLRHFLVLPIALLLVGYGYGSEDPLVAAFKEVSAKLAAGNWEGVGQAIKDAAPQLDNQREHFGGDLIGEMDRALLSKDRAGLGSAWIRLTIDSIRLHLWWSCHEGLNERSKDKARLSALDRYLKDILGPQIKAGDPARQTRIAKIIGGLREALGSPGAFGLGAVPRNETGFVQLSADLEIELWAAFPSAAPLWTKRSGDPAALVEQASQAPDFLTRRACLDELRWHLRKQGAQGWEAIYLKAVALMGRAAHGKELEVKPAADFSATLKSLILPD